MKLELWQFMIGVFAYLAIGLLLAPLVFKQLLVTYDYYPIHSKTVRLLTFGFLAYLWPIPVSVILMVIMIESFRTIGLLRTISALSKAIFGPYSILGLSIRAFKQDIIKNPS